MFFPKFRWIPAALALAAFLAPATAGAAQWRPYDHAAFVKAQQAGKTVLVSVYADW